MPSSRYTVNEIFRSIQGEGYWTGWPCTFVRFQGCNKRCSFCDTPGAQDLAGGKTYGLQELVAEVRRTYGLEDRVVLTGGEPTLQDLTPLVVELRRMALVHLETNGSVFQSNEFWDQFNWVTLSPKGDVSTYLARYRANEIKWLVGDLEDIEGLLAFLRASQAPSRAIWIQPISQDPAATKLAYEACLKWGWRLSVQVHKYIKVR